MCGTIYDIKQNKHRIYKHFWKVFKSWQIKNSFSNRVSYSAFENYEYCGPSKLGKFLSLYSSSSLPLSFSLPVTPNSAII